MLLREHVYMLLTACVARAHHIAATGMVPPHNAHAQTVVATAWRRLPPPHFRGTTPGG